jgi:site-specific DNA-methyltransferase (adenine-specific)
VSRRQGSPPIFGEFQIFPPYSKPERAALKKSIERVGTLVPVEVDQNNVIIDGHHRVELWNELRAEGKNVRNYKTNIRHYRDDQERLERAVTFNDRRRHLDAAQRKTVARKLRKRGWSLRRIAEELGVGSSTIKRDVSGVPGGTPEKVTGLDNKRYSGSSRFEVLATSPREVEQSLKAIAALEGNLPSRPTTASRLQKRADTYQVRLGVEPDGTAYDGAGWSLTCQDFRKWKLKPNSLDIIVTDPPYPRSGIPLYGELSRFAKRHLKPGGLCIAYAGKYFLPELMIELARELEWVWAVVIIQTSHPTRTFPKKMFGEYRPALVFSKGPYKPDKWMHDVIIAKQSPEKEHHRWQQSVDPVRQIIAMATKPGDLVCDPFACSGTTGVAALGLGRSFAGCEINPKSARVGADRIRRFVDSQET